MYKFMTATFLMLGWVFFEMSGGTDFQPEEQIIAEAAPVAEPVAPEVEVAEATIVRVAQPVVEPSALLAESDQVTRAVSLDLSDIAEIVEEAAVSADLVAAPAVVETPAVEVVAAFDPVDLREVAGNRVNMRSGPGTNYGVLDTLTRGTETEVLEVDATGWARVRVIGSGQVGWMAERLLASL